MSSVGVGACRLRSPVESASCRVQELTISSTFAFCPRAALVSALNYFQMRWLDRRLEDPPILQRHPPTRPVARDDMVEDLDPEKRARRRQPAGERQVLG